jgi:2,3-bisphosphoglycerate-dependent phosphoglycerate mutase
MMRTDIYLVRHAHSNYSRDELGRGVSEKGKSDLELVTELLFEENINVFFSSPYRRAIETIEGAAKALRLDINIEEKFKERILSQAYIDDFESAIKWLWDNPSFALEGGESNVEAAQRGVEGILNILDRHRGKRIAVGTHGNIMTIIMNSFDKRYDYSFWKVMSMPDIYRLSFENNELIGVKRIWKE